jgi:hypothetical protein
MDEKALSYGFEKQTILGNNFFHRIYLSNNKLNTSILHIYIEGDGLPWQNPGMISSDPTPKNSLMLSLMAKDPTISIYLGRPCYFGFAQIPPCSSRWWTSARFAPEIVNSMATVLERIIAAHKRANIVLIGHSGGGALAVLLAHYFPKVLGVVTLAGNLDVSAWTRLHGYSELVGSLNPVNMPPLEKHIIQLHFQGGEDNNIPVAITSDFAAKQPFAKFRIYPKFDHYCCWEEIWPKILQTLSNEIKNPLNTGRLKKLENNSMCFA